MFSILRGYVRQSLELRGAYRQGPSLLRPLALLPRWRMELGSSPLQKKLPWITYGAIDLLETILQNDTARVFEYGSGGSTLFLPGAPPKSSPWSMTPQWAEAVGAALDAAERHNVRRLLVTPEEFGPSSGTDDSDPQACLSSSFPGRTLEKYVSAIDAFPDKYFDLVLVDGRARPSCLTHAMPKVADGGYLMLDNADRPRYRRAQQALQKPEWERHEFPGPGPANTVFALTVAWRKRSQ